MILIDHQFVSPVENVAFDEVLLHWAEGSNEQSGAEVLRVWQAREPCVVVGRSTRIREEINLDAAKLLDAPVIRRVSGGTSIVASKGCMFYTMLLSLEQRPQLRAIDVAHQFVMQRLISALQPLESRLRFDGTCDIVVEDRKVSGNAVRVGRNWMLYHGTLLLNMDLQLADQLLFHPPREPEYRNGRTHGEFIANLNLEYDAVAQRLASECAASSFRAVDVLNATKHDLEQLVREKYLTDQWTFSR